MKAKHPIASATRRTRVITLPTKTKACRECCEPIALDAKKCKTCSEYQDVRRFLSFSSTFLALTVAFVSVISLSIPIITKALDEKNSKINIIYQGAQNDKAYFLVTNSGTRDGTISYINFVVSTPMENSGNDDRVALRFDVPPITVNGGKSQQITVNLSGDARTLIDRSVYQMWRNNISAKPVKLPQLQFRIGYISFKEATLREIIFSPPLNDLLRAGPTKWYKCASSIAWSDWNGPGSHFFPEDIDPGAAEAFCGKPPPTFNDQKRGAMPSLKADADFP